MPTFTLIFLVALILGTLFRCWLANRHIGYIRRHQAQVPPEFLEKITLDVHQKAAQYTIAKTRLGMTQTLLEILILLGWTLGGGLARLDQFWLEKIDSEIGQGIALIISVIIISGLLDLPLTIYRTFNIEAKFGFNKITPKLFVTDLIKQTLLGACFGIPLLFCILWLMAKMGELWWLYVWLVWVGFNLFLLAIYPTFIAPLFNKFTPLEDQTLRERIEQLLAKCGFRAEGVFVMDGSKRSSHGNAYFTGFGKTKRIVFFDTLLKHLSPPEMEAVLAHELGHFKRHHVIKRIGLAFVVSLAVLWILGALIDQAWFYQGLQVDRPSTAMALLLFFLVMSVFAFPLQALSSFYSRKHEFEADQYAAEQANAGDLINGLVKLYRDNAATLTPDPLHSAFYDSHPPATVRIARLRQAASSV